MRLNYVVIPLTVLGIAILGSAFTNVGIDSGWYDGLLKPSWTPRGGVIGAMWSIIFALGTMSLLIVWNRLAHDNTFRHFASAFLLNGLLNVSWSYVFFVQNRIGLALIIAVAMWFSVIELIVTLWPLKKIPALLLVPYAGWLVVACTLNYFIYRLN
ncbi:MAG: TspO/MBR family protein [Patescibacteria group bacterium]